MAVPRDAVGCRAITVIGTLAAALGSLMGCIKMPTSDLLAAYNAANEDAKLGTKTLAAAMRVKGFDKALRRFDGVAKQAFCGVELVPATPFLEQDFE